jgi:hypothetical protein
VHQLTRRAAPEAGWAARVARLFSRQPYVVAAGALLVGMLVINAPGTYALWNDTQAGTPVTIQTGNLSATISAPVLGTSAIAAAPAGVVVRPGTTGMVPGVQAQTLTYTVTNTGSERVPAKVSFTTHGHRDPATAAAWTALQPHLKVRVAMTGTGEAELPTSGVTTTDSPLADFTSQVPVILQPGATVNIVFTFSIPNSVGTAAELRSLQQYGAGSSASASSLLHLHPVVTLTQVPRHV